MARNRQGKRRRTSDANADVKPKKPKTPKFSLDFCNLCRLANQRCDKRPTTGRQVCDACRKEGLMHYRLPLLCLLWWDTLREQHTLSEVVCTLAVEMVKEAKDAESLIRRCSGLQQLEFQQDLCNPNGVLAEVLNKLRFCVPKYVQLAQAAIDHIEIPGQNQSSEEIVRAMRAKSFKPESVLGAAHNAVRFCKYLQNSNFGFFETVVAVDCLRMERESNGTHVTSAAIAFRNLRQLIREDSEHAFYDQFKVIIHDATMAPLWLGQSQLVDTPAPPSAGTNHKQEQHHEEVGEGEEVEWEVSSPDTLIDHILDQQQHQSLVGLDALIHATAIPADSTDLSDYGNSIDASDDGSDIHASDDGIDIYATIRNDVDSPSRGIQGSLEASLFPNASSCSVDTESSVFDY